MNETAQQMMGPPPIRRQQDGSLQPAWVADLIEWFLNYDERTARMRLAQVNDLFLWKQADDGANGVATYPFENAEARFAIGVFQALRENNSEPLLALWLNDLTAALHEAKKTRSEIAEANKIDETSTGSVLEKTEKLTTKTERRLYLSSCWIEALCTAEARVLGWAYQELYGRPFTPAT